MITLSIPDVEKAFSFLTEVRVEDCLPFYGGINANKNVKLCWATEWRTNNYKFANHQVRRKKLHSFYRNSPNHFISF